MKHDPVALRALADRVEALAGPDREVDAQVGRYFAAQFLGYVPWEPQTGCAKFTASLDAALSLVPEGWVWMTGCAPDGAFFATLSPTDESGIALGMIDTLAATPALALCAAALRALAHHAEHTADSAGKGDT